METVGSTIKPAKLDMVVVMGETGAGKSFFINKLAGKEVTKEGDSIESCTERCYPVPVTIGGTTILMIDTPGFGDHQRPASEILAEIATILVAQHRLGIQLVGVIYVHRITDVRFTRSAGKTLNMVQKICGPRAMENVILLTSGWSYKGGDDRAFTFREAALRDGPWSKMLKLGSETGRFFADQMSAMMIISQVIAKKPVVLEIQTEICNLGRELRDTAAGSFLYEDLVRRRREYEGLLLGRSSDKRQKQKKPQAGPKKKVRKGGEEEIVASIERTRTLQENMHVRIDVEVEEQVNRRGWGQEMLSAWQAVAPLLHFVLGILFDLLGAVPL